MISTHLLSLFSAQQLNAPASAIEPQIIPFAACHQDIVKVLENSFLCQSDEAHKQPTHLSKLGKTEKKA